MLDKIATFNVAIRTLTIDTKTKKGLMGIGSGIVWDSIPEKEWNETLLKSSFLNSPTEYFQLFETMLVDSGKIIFFEEHIARMKLAAEFFLFFFNEKKLISRISKAVLQLDSTKKYKLKLLLDKWGNTRINTFPVEEVYESNSILISAKPVDSHNTFQYFKTTNRELYDSEYSKFSKSGFFDVIFINEKGEITEGCISNIFIRMKGTWVTPPVSAGILPGIYRNFLLKTQPGTIEASVSIKDLAEAEDVKMVNSVRGEIKIDRVYFNQHEFLQINQS
jgi:para-aminobenzoate synthetase/4-amino-4-deoxychorismate lyase